jgi:uncharacterized SAM-binding protein YcdF (DUF218 family)
LTAGQHSPVDVESADEAAGRTGVRRRLAAIAGGVWRRRWARRILLAAGIVAIAYFTSGWWLPAAGRWLDVGEIPRRADYCLILSGDEQSRPFAAAALYRRGFVQNQIWLTQTAMPDTPVAERQAANKRVRRILMLLGVPAERIVELPGECTTTFDEAGVLARALESHPTASVNVVTSDYHTHRARWTIQHVLGKRAERIRYVSVPTDYFDAGCWWKNEEGFTTYSKEFLKTGFYSLRYGWAGVWAIAIVLGAAAWRIVRRYRRRRDFSSAVN